MPAGAGTSSSGAYRLRLERQEGTAIERAIYASPYTRVQVFLQVTDFLLTDGTKQRLADMSGSALAISPEQEFSPQRQRIRLAELARYALTQNRRILADGMLGELLDEKFDDPMLGFSAHTCFCATGPKTIGNSSSSPTTCCACSDRNTRTCAPYGAAARPVTSACLSNCSLRPCSGGSGIWP